MSSTRYETRGSKVVSAVNVNEIVAAVNARQAELGRKLKVLVLAHNMEDKVPWFGQHEQGATTIFPDLAPLNLFGELDVPHLREQIAAHPLVATKGKIDELVMGSCLFATSPGAKTYISTLQSELGVRKMTTFSYYTSLAFNKPDPQGPLVIYFGAMKRAQPLGLEPVPAEKPDNEVVFIAE